MDCRNCKNYIGLHCTMYDNIEDCPIINEVCEHNCEICPAYINKECIISMDD